MFDPVAQASVLCGFAASGASARECREAISGAKRLRAWADSVEAAALARLQGLAGSNASQQSAIGSELRGLTGVSPAEARRRLGVAKGIGQLPAVRGALESGEITLGHAQALTDAARESSAAAAAVAEAQAELVERAATEPVDEFAKRVAKVVAGADPEAIESKAARQHRRRRVTRHTDDLGMSILRAELPPLVGDEVWRVLCHIARRLWRAQHPDQPAESAPSDLALQTPSVTYQQLLADALAEMARLAASGTGRGIVPHVSPVVLIDYETLVHGVHEHTVCETTDGTPVAPSEVRRLACEAGLLPAVLGSRGQVLDLGTQARFASSAQKQALDIMWGGCFLDGCGAGPDYTHAHHIEPYGAPFGPTDLINLVSPCSVHHRLIHDGTLSVAQPELGHVVVTHRDGTVTHHHAKHPPPGRASPDSGSGEASPPRRTRPAGATRSPGATTDDRAEPIPDHHRPPHSDAA